MSQMKISSKFQPKTHLTRSPTLLIGIGGIGGQIVSLVNERLSDHDRSKIEMLIMDTDSSAIEKESDAGIKCIQTSENRSVESFLSANREYIDFFPLDPFINDKNLINGAGQIRAVSRLGALSCKENGGFNPIKKAVEDILKNHGDPVNKSVRIMIVGSITGGTGSGLGIQLPFYVRKVLADANIPNTVVRGLFLTPSLTDSEEIQDTDNKQKAVNTNGYAFLKELNAFYKLQTKPASENILELEEYVPGMKGDSVVKVSGSIPYDFLFLVEKAGKKGSIGGIEEYIDRSADIVISQLFSPLANRGLSAEDNLITSTVEEEGMNRYCGAGISKAIYPKEEVVRYCTLKCAEHIFGNYWVKVDEKVRLNESVYKATKASNSSLKAMDRGKEFCKVLNEMCDPAKSNVVSEMVSVKNDTKISVTQKLENGKEETTEYDLAELLIKKIKAHLDAEFEETNIPTQADIRLQADEKNDKTSVESAVTEAITALRNLKKDAQSKVSDRLTTAVDQIIPIDIRVAKDNAETAQHNLYAMLKNRHPVAIRYILYSLLDLLKQEKELATKIVTEAAEEESLFAKDYIPNGKDNVKETPIDALGKTREKWLALIPTGAYIKLVKTIKEDVVHEAQKIKDDAYGTMLTIVYEILIKRVECLIKVYENFFSGIETVLEGYKKEISEKERGKGEGNFNIMGGDLYVCSTSECKKALYQEFADKIGDSGMDMSKEQKGEFFDKIFAEFELEQKLEQNPNAKVTRKSSKKLLEEGVLNPIIKKFENTGYRHLDMSILDAFYKQYCIEDKDPQPKDSTEFRKYFAERCKRLQTLATPYLNYETTVAGFNSGGHLTWTWSLNNAGVADFQSGDVEGDVDETSLRTLFDVVLTPLVDDSISPYVLTCYSTIYDLRIENCVTYKKGSTSANDYDERLQNYANRVGKVTPATIGGSVGVIHPHLDRRWHQHAYLPELMQYDDDKMCADIKLAFLLGVALKKCDYYPNADEHLTCWWYGRDPISMDEKPLESKSIYALYKAFDRDRIMVEEILAGAEAERDEVYNKGSYAGISEDDVLSHPIVASLIKHTDIEGNDQSVLDLIYMVYKNVANLDVVAEFIPVLKNYIYEYCKKMMQQNENRTKALQERIIKAIGEASACREEAPKNFKEVFKEFFN